MVLISGTREDAGIHPGKTASIQRGSFERAAGHFRFSNRTYSENRPSAQTTSGPSAISGLQRSGQDYPLPFRLLDEQS